jgi:hypothetical protein
MNITPTPGRDAKLCVSTAPPAEDTSWRSASQEEKRWVLVFAVLVMLVTTLPYLFGYFAQGQAYRFSGFVFGVEDGNSYIAKMLSGSSGDWLFRTPYTAYPQAGLFVYIPYLLLGKLAAPPGLHEQLVSLYHIFRFLAGMLAILASYEFLAYFIRDIRLRRLGVALACLGGGLGWLLVLLGKQNWLGSLPLDFYSPEAFGFLGLYGLPHIAMARALLLWALLAYLNLIQTSFEPSQARPGYRNGFMRRSIQLSLLWLLAGLFQPLTLVLIGVVIGWHQFGVFIYQFIRQHHGQVIEGGYSRRMLGWLLAAAVLPALFTAYNLGISFFDPYAQIWTTQNIIRSPNILHYLLAYGLLAPFAWLGGRRLLRGDIRIGWLPVGWVLIFPLLAYAPLDLQRRLTEGVWLAWCVLALAALDQPIGRPASAAQTRLGLRFAPLWLAFPSTIFLLVGGSLAAWHPAQPVFRTAAQVRVFDYLLSKTTAGAVVLGAFDTCNALPAWAPVRVLVGHGPESIYKSELEPQIVAFYQSQASDDQRWALIDRFDIAYIFWGPAERNLGDWQPSSASYLTLVQQQGDYALYEVGSGP